jgi:hypothetical protein
MVKYKCLRCGFAHSVKSTFINHLNRKFICKPKINNISIDKIYKYYFKINHVLYNGNIAKIEPTVAKIEPTRNDNNHIANTETTLINDIRCKYCNRAFKHLSSRYKHESKRCRLKEELNNKKILLEKIQLEENLKKILEEKLNLEKELENREKDKEIIKQEIIKQLFIYENKK